MLVQLTWFDWIKCQQRLCFTITCSLKYSFDAYKFNENHYVKTIDANYSSFHRMKKLVKDINCFRLIILISNKSSNSIKTTSFCFLETSTSDMTLKLKIDLENIAIPVGEITVNSKYAKRVAFILTKPNGDSLPKYEVLNKIKSCH